FTFCQILIDCSPKEVSHRVGTIHPEGEFKGQDLRTACEEMLLSERLCVPTKCDPVRTYSAYDLIYALNYHLNHQWTVAIITKPHGVNIDDVQTGKGT
ncbi:unnamed protein product, partial [Hymenolepis diminuta]